ncbi:uncharacterized protein LOC135948375 [Cloeon dipterum]|uniref:uncharacterized protein LOC135948375 n=1 Tax=Cloeon dipterum TaxID=197152 RepID=UPI00321FC52F
MQTEENYFAYCLDTNTNINYFVVPSKFLKPRPKAINSKPGVAWVTLGQDFWGGVFQSAWLKSLEMDPDDGFFLDKKPDKDFEHLLTEAEYKDCLVLATASSVQELQVFVQTCNIKIPKKYKRLDYSDASGSQQLNETQQQNKQLESAESNQQTSNKDISTASKGSEESNSATIFPGGATPFVLPQERKEIDLEKPIESHDVSENDYRGNSHIRPKGVANLGFFESEKDGMVNRKNADNVCVLVIHYDFKNDPELIRNGDARDVKHIERIFGGNRNCNFRNFRSPNKKTLLQLLGDQEKLLQYFNSKDDVPSVFVLFILSHGTENGTILTDLLDSETNKYEYFTTDEVLDSLQNLKKFEKCLKVVNFGPCRGMLVDSKFVKKNSYPNYKNDNSCRITNRPGMHNYVVFYSTVETTLANTDENGSWMVRNMCTCLDSATDDESLLKFFTIVQNRMHQESRSLMNLAKNTHIGQTPELKMFQQDKKFIISKAKIPAKPSSNTDGSGNVSKVSNEIQSVNFSWKSDEGQDIRGRRCFILSVVRNKQVQEMTRALQNLDFEITDWTLSGKPLGFYLKTVSELEPDVGCILTCIFGPVCENEEKEVCVRVQKGKNIPIKDILYSLVGPRNDKLIGKPKILFVVNVEAPKTDSISLDVKDLQVSATNHSGWLVLILKYEDSSEKLIQQLGNIGDKSLQELLEPLLTRESNREDAVLLNSTLQYILKFPIWPRAFVNPDFKLKTTKIPRDQMVAFGNSKEYPIGEKIDLDTLIKMAKRLFEENKKSIESPLQEMSHVENSEILSDIETSIKFNQVRELESISEAENSAEASIVWLFNSVARAGKSTVLKEMAHQLTKQDGGFKVLLIPLKKHYRYLFDMPAMNVNEIEFLAKTSCNSLDDINNWIEKRELIVFLDGFDEVCPDFRDKIIHILIAINKARVPVFIGTRPHEVHHIQERIQNTTIIEIEPLDEAKQIEFLRIVGRKNEKDINQLRENFKDKDILGNPLYLNLLADYNGDGNLYEIFDTIVRRKVEICLKRENGGKDVGEEKIENSLKFIQLVASRFVTGVKIDQGSVTKELLEEMNAFGVVTYYNDTVNFTHQVFAEFLTAQKCIYDLKNPVSERVPLFNDELMQCRKFVDLFFSTEMGKDTSFKEAFTVFAKSTDKLQLVKQICRENLRQMFNFLNPDLSLKDEDGKNAFHFALRHLEMAKMVHEKNSMLATEITNNGENCLHLAIDDEECSEKVALWIMQNIEVDKNAETKSGDTPLLLAGKRKKWEVAQQLVLKYNVEDNKIDSTGNTFLHYAVQSNNIDLVRVLLQRGSDVNFKNKQGNSALYLAAGLNKNPQIVKILLQKGAKVNAKNNDNWTAIHCAASNNPNVEVIQKLLENGADVDSQTKLGATALHLAARNNKNPEIVKLLLGSGAKINAKENDNCTALHCAASNNPNVEVIQKLLENGANVDSQNEEGTTALHLAARNNRNPEIVRLLLGSGAKINAKDNDNWTALHKAASNNPNVEVIQKLLENGADVDSQTKLGNTALHLAARYNENPEIVRILLQKGAKINAKDNDNWTALHKAASNNPNVEVIQKLLENGANVDSQSKLGATALHLAARNNKNPEIVKLLLGSGAKINAKDNDNCTALHYAASCNPNVEVIQKLLENGADVDSHTKEGYSALQCAASNNPNVEVIQKLLENGADVDSQTKLGNTALHLAARYNENPEIVRILLQKGAKINAKDNDNWTALHKAASNNPNVEVIQKLLENGANVDSQSKLGATALHLAAWNNKNPEIVKLLLGSGAKINAKDNDNCTALHYAASCNPNVEVIQKLLENGADVDSHTKEGYSALQCAASNNPNVEVIQKLLENGADVDSQTKLGATALHLAARNNKNPEIVKLLLGSGAKINAKDNDNCTALHYAASCNPNVEVIQKLLENGADVDSHTKEGYSALQCAASNNPNVEVIQKLLENGADVHSHTKEGYSALQCAASNNPNVEVIQKLLENGADVDSQTKLGATALHLAARNNKNPEIVKLLLGSGAKINAKDNDNCTALHYAASCNPNVEVIQKLLENGADVDSHTKEGYSALQCAASNNPNVEVIQKLLENGADVHSHTKEGYSALQCAASNNPNVEVIQKLLENGADVDSQTKLGATALHLAARNNKNPEIVKLLLGSGAKINAKDNDNCTALHYAASCNPNVEVIQKLLENGADVDSHTKEGYSALQCAASNNPNVEVIQKLLENGADVHSHTKEGYSALQCAASNNPNVEVIQKLLENGADVHSQIGEGSTALHLAARNNRNPEIVRLLLGSGAKINAKNNDKWTALHKAATFNSNPEVVQELLDQGAEINVENDCGRTALFLAVKHNPVKRVITKLREHGAKEINDKEYILF